MRRWNGGGGGWREALLQGREDVSVANVSLIVAIDRVQLVEQVGKLTARKLERVRTAGGGGDAGVGGGVGRSAISAFSELSLKFAH